MLVLPFVFTALTGNLISAGNALALTLGDNSNADLPPLVEGQRIPDVYLFRAGFNLTKLYDTSTYNSTIYKRDTHSECNTTPTSGLVGDLNVAVDLISKIGGCGNSNDKGSGCTTMKRHGTGAIGVCGGTPFWHGRCDQLVPYLRGIISTCAHDFGGGVIKSGGLQVLNDWERQDTPAADGNQPYVIVFHS